MSTPIELVGDELKQLVLVHEIQTHPVSDQLLHVDFLAVRRDKKVTADVSVVLEGVSLIQKNNIGSIQLIKDTIEVEAFPQDLPHDIKIDISKIEHLHDVIFVKDIDL
jgi:large subunit ribosomal protein L25